jgi:UPF0755 protein
MQKDNKTLRRVARIFFAITVLNVLVALAAWWSLHHYWHQPRPFVLQKDSFKVEKGATLTAVISGLVHQGLLQEETLTKLCLRFFSPDLQVKTGRYQLLENGSYAELFELLASGVSVQHRITLVEGKTLAQAIASINAHLKSLGIETGAAVDAQALLSAKAIALMPSAAKAEGWFYPDTYYFSEDDSAADILRRAHNKMLAVLFDEWPSRAAGLPYQSPYEALVMASLIERETGAVHERSMIAGVFVRRLQLNMRLQTDPSVIYGMGDSYNGNLRRADLKRDTPYNTYSRHGLPPTPIALSGREAIHAALHPAQSEALYFVAKGDGSHHFSATHEEHVKAVRNYQVFNRAGNYRSSPATSK